MIKLFDWDKLFAENRTLCIQNTKPPHETAFNTFQRDKELILSAARKYGHRQQNEKGRSISFVKPL